MNPVKTTCAYCGVGCGVLAFPDGSIKGDPEHPANFGRLCSKGAALGETVGLEGRLLSPMVKGAEASWDVALDLVASRFRQTIAEHGPDSVAFYVSGQLLTEDYYVANKLMKGFIGSANIDTNSRLCMASSVAGHKRAFGSDTVPGTYEDLELADVVVLAGSNLAWCHPVLHQRILAAKEKRKLTIVTIDPRRTVTAETSDMHLAIRPGSDVVLWNGLLAWIEGQGGLDAGFIAEHVNGENEALDAARGFAVDVVAAECGLEPKQVAAFYRLWLRHEKVVSVYSQGVNQAHDGTDRVNAIINCHLATGRIGKPGMGPFSVTGQPNAMGGREVGGMANMLAAHLEIGDSKHRRIVQQFWNSPVIANKPGLKAVEMFDAVADGRIKAIWIMCTNPVVSMPRADFVRAALANCPFVVVSDIVVDTDTSAVADVLLPATGWGEKDGTVTNSERRISRQRAFLPVPGLARDDWRIVCDVAGRMGFGGFGFASPAEVFDEHAALSGLAGTDFDISGLVGGDYDAMEPVQWPVSAAKTGGRFFGDRQFFTSDGKARMLALVPRDSPNAVSAEFPLLLNTGRVRDQWHTMTRTGKSPKLNQHIGEPFVEVNPTDALRSGLEPADLARVSSVHGEIVVRVQVTDRVLPGSVFVPMHWNGLTSATSRVDALIAPVVDPVSGQPELKRTAVRVDKFQAAWFGFAVSRQEPTPNTAYFSKKKNEQGWAVELAGTDTPPEWESFARDMVQNKQAVAVSYSDAGRGQARIALVEGEQVLAALFVSRAPVKAARTYLAGLAGLSVADVLAGCAGAGRPDAGAVVCACFSVGVNTILAGIAGGLVSVEAIGAALQAGTNCGSCKPELRGLLARGTALAAA